MVLVQYLRDFFVVTDHPGAVVDLLRQEAVQENSRRNGSGRTVRGRAGQVAYAPALGQETVFLAELLSVARPHDSLVRAGAHPAAAVTGAEGGGEVDAG